MAKRRRQSGDDPPVSKGSHNHDDDESVPRAKKARIEDKKTLFIRSLPPSATKDTLTDWFSQHYPVKHATVVLDSVTKASKGYGFVTFTDQEDAAAAKEKLNNSVLDGRRLRLEFAEPRHRVEGHDGEFGKVSAAKEQKAKRKLELEQARKSPKLIVRNLPWSIKSPDQLAALFRAYGKVKYADLPNNKGKLSGFGFVTLRGKKNAENAINGVNGKTVDGRTLAVDWAVDKAAWERQKGVDETGDSEEEEDDVDHSVKGATTASHETTKARPVADKKNVEDDEDADLQNFLANHMENLEDEDGSDSEGEEEHPSDSDQDKEAEALAPKPQLSSDNSTTLFIRNLPFTTTEVELKAHFTQFGPVRYARCVMERTTDRPAGTGFVCFVRADDFTSCLRSAPRQAPPTASLKHSVLQNESVDHDGRYTIQGRVLQVSKAISKEEATRLSAEGPAAKRGESKDKRRLFLLGEGTIPRNSPLASLMTPAEMQMREASARQRQKLVQSNPSLYASLTRLALRNIPRNLDSKALKALAREAVVAFATDVDAGRRAALSREEVARGGLEDKEAERRRKAKGHGVVRQAKIIFETTEGSKIAEQHGGGGKSRGYGFIEYSSHRWALMGLRWLNGHALRNEAGKTQRLIAEFAIENAQVVARRKSAQERSRDRPTGRREEGSGTGPRAAAFKGRSEQVKTAPMGKKPQTKAVTAEKTNGASVEQGKVAKGDAKLALRQQIIGRKRMLRKKKRGVAGKH